MHKFQDEQLISVWSDINNQFAVVLPFNQSDESVGCVFQPVNNIFAVPDAPFGKPVSCLFADIMFTSAEKPFTEDVTIVVDDRQRQAQVVGNSVVERLRFAVGILQFSSTGSKFGVHNDELFFLLPACGYINNRCEAFLP